MKKIYLLAVIILSTMLSGCFSEKTKTQNKEASVTLTPIEGYFTTLKPEKIETLLIKDQSEFDKNFNPAKTMTNSLTKVNFEKEQIGAIILPETEYETNIIINKSYIENNTLYVSYTIDRKDEKRSFTTIPQLAFKISSTSKIDAIESKQE